MSDLDEKIGARLLMMYRQAEPGEQADFLEFKSGIKFKRYASVFIGKDGRARQVDQ
jgi:hypothetical protein